MKEEFLDLKEQYYNTILRFIDWISLPWSRDKGSIGLNILKDQYTILKKINNNDYFLSENPPFNLKHFKYFEIY